MALRDLTPEEEAALRQKVPSRQVVAEPAPTPKGTPPKTLPSYFMDPADKALSGRGRMIVDEAKQDYIKNKEFSGIEEQFITNYGAGVAANNVPEGYLSEPSGILEQVAAGAGHGAGMLTDIGIAGLLGVPAPVAFTGYGAAQPADGLGERAKNAVKFLLLDRVLNALPRALVGGVGAATAKVRGQEFGRSAARATMKMLENPLGKLAYNQAVFSGLTEVEGGSAKDDFWRNLGTSMAFSVPRGTSSPRPPKGETSPTFRDGGVAEPIPGVPASVPMSRYLKGEISRAEYVVESAEAAKRQTGAVSPEAIKRTYEAIKEGNVQRVQDGKDPKPADESTVYAKALSASVSPEVRNEVSSGLKEFTLSESVDKNRTISEITRYNKDSAVANNTLRLGEMGELVENKMRIDYAKEARAELDKIGLKDDSRAEELLNRMKDEYDAGVEKVPEFMDRRGNEIVAKHGKGVNQAEVDLAINGLDILDGLYRNYATERNMVNREYSGEEFTGREAYLPKVQQKVSPLRHPVQRFKQETETIQASVHDGKTLTPGKVRSPRERHRTDSDMKYPREYRGSRILEGYVADQARRMARQPVISASKGVVAEIKNDMFRRKELKREMMKEAKGMEEVDPDLAAEIRREAEGVYSKEMADGAERTAQAIDGVIQASYNDIRYGGVAKRMQALTSNRTGMTALRASRLYKRMFNMAKYKMNIPFIALRQWTSSFQGLGVSHDVKPADLIKALTRTLRGGGHEDVMDTYTGNIKSNQHGTMRHELTGDVQRPEIRRRGPIEKAVSRLDEATDRPTNKMEEMTNRFAMEVADIIAQRRGLSGRDAANLKSDVIHRMQSSYNRESMAEIRRDPVLNALLPAQSYSLTVWDNIRFAGSKSQRAKVVAAAAMSALVYQYATGYLRPGESEELDNFAIELGLNTLASMVPYSSVITGLGPGDGKSAPAGFLEDIVGNAPSLIAKAMNANDNDKENIYYEKAVNEIVKNLVPAGEQISRAISADIMLKQGVITDDDMAQASTLGWWTTSRGKKYLRAITGHGKEKSSSSTDGRR